MRGTVAKELREKAALIQRTKYPNAEGKTNNQWVRGSFKWCLKQLKKAYYINSKRRDDNRKLLLEKRTVGI